MEGAGGTRRMSDIVKGVHCCIVLVFGLLSQGGTGDRQDLACFRCTGYSMTEGRTSQRSWFMPFVIVKSLSQPYIVVNSFMQRYQ